MFARRLLLAGIAAAFSGSVGCGGAAPPRSARRDLGSVDEPSDPRVVRCGVDDAPLGDRRARAEVQRAATTLAFPPGVNLFPPPSLTPPAAKLGPIALTDVDGRPLPPDREELLFFRLGELHACAPLAAAERDGEPSRVVVDLASSGVPLRVATDTMPSAMVSCVLERACRLRGAPVAQRVAFSVRAEPDLSR